MALRATSNTFLCPPPKSSDVHYAESTKNNSAVRHFSFATHALPHLCGFQNGHPLAPEQAPAWGDRGDGARRGPGGSALQGNRE